MNLRPALSSFYKTIREKRFQPSPPAVHFQEIRFTIALKYHLCDHENNFFRKNLFFLIQTIYIECSDFAEIVH